MNRLDTIRVLNRLFRTLHRSLPMYVKSGRLWTQHEAQEALQTLRRVAEEQEADAGRLADAIFGLRGQLETGQFPVAFTALNDLAVPYIVKLAIDHQQRDVQAIRGCVDQLAGQADLRSLGEEIVQSAQGHLADMEKVAASDASGVKT
jgi:hypothetical protein